MKRSSLLELSSSQFIIKLLHTELNDVTEKHAPVSDAISKSGGYEDPAMPTTWSKVTLKYSHNTNKSRTSEVLQTLQLVPITNQYSALANFPESMTGKHEAVPLEGEKSTQPLLASTRGKRIKGELQIQKLIIMPGFLHSDHLLQSTMILEVNQ
jgi:hypothetical protein